MHVSSRDEDETMAKFTHKELLATAPTVAAASYLWLCHGRACQGWPILLLLRRHPLVVLLLQHGGDRENRSSRSRVCQKRGVSTMGYISREERLNKPRIWPIKRQR